MYDLIIRGGTVADGSGAPSYRADVAVKDGIIAAIGPLKGEAAKETLSAEQRIVAPGFIDIHSHDDLYLLENRRTEAKIRQGITTTVIGNCGFGLFPVVPARKALFEQYAGSLFGLPEDVNCFAFADMKSFVRELTRRGCSMNVATLVAHGVIRIAAMGFEQRQPDAAEMAAMKQMLRQAIREGAVGMSMGLIYAPGAYADTNELIELSKVAAEEGGIITSHIRGESNTLEQSVEEMLTVASKSGAPLEISHLKACGVPNFGKSKTVLKQIAEARSQGVDVTFDQYPYPAGSTTITTLLPPWSLEGGVGQMLERLRDPQQRALIREQLLNGIPGSHWETMWRLIGWDNIVVCAVQTERNASQEGRSFAKIAAATGEAEVDVFLRMVEEEQGKIMLVMFQQDEEDLERIMRHDLQMFGTDGLPLRGKKAHPRLYGTYPRVLGTYVRQKGILSLERAVAKMTCLPANRLGLLDRGLLRPGLAADITVFDPAAVEDRSTYQEPAAHPEGIAAVIVNGVPVLVDGTLTGSLPGRALTRTERTGG